MALVAGGLLGWVCVGVRAQVPLLEVGGDGSYGGFGRALAALGDVDGDGAPEIAIGAPFAEVGGLGVGRVRVVSGADGHELFSLHGDASSELFGWAVSGVGDVDGDGAGDLLIGAPHANGFAGRALLVSGADGHVVHEWQGQAGDRFGWVVGPAGDRDGDGLTEVFVGAWGVDADALTPEVGAVSIFAPGSGLLLDTLAGTAAWGHFGSAVAAPGDADLDGVPDLAVGSITEDVGELSDPGVVRWLSGADDTLLHLFVGEQIDDHLGDALAGAGDIDQDGVPDLCLGIPGSTAVSVLAGRVVVRSGATGGQLLAIAGEPAFGELGRAVAGVGDIDDDGVPDLLLGAPNWGTSVFFAGEIRLVSGADGHDLFRLTGDQANASLGAAVAGLGDVDGNGVPDVLVGIPGANGPWPGQGNVLVLSGSPWSQVGSGLSGSGAVPGVHVAGTPHPGEPVTLWLELAPAGAPAVLVGGLSQLAAPFKGGILVPFPDFVSPAFSVDPTGQLALGGDWPALAPEGFTVFFQWWVADAGAPSGFASSPGVEIVTL